MKKQELLEIIERLPDQYDPETLMHDLYLKAKLERAEEAINRGDVLSHGEVVARGRQWFALCRNRLESGIPS